MILLKILNKTDIKTEHFENEIKWLIRAFYKNEALLTESEEEPRLSVDITMTEDDLKISISKAGESFSKEESWDIKKDKEAKDILKRALYKCCNKESGRDLPWGTLTGIRPVKRMVSMLDSGKSEEEVFRIYKEDYYVSGKKAELCLTIAKKERELLNDIDLKNGFSLYAGVPFCRTICNYCSFPSMAYSAGEKDMEGFLRAFSKEAEEVSKMLSSRKLTSVYIGGGTPVSLKAPELKEFLKIITDNFDVGKAVEFSVEAGRADSIDEEKLCIIKDTGADRISINPQSMNEKTLKRIGRDHSPEDVINAFRLARNMGFDNINMDTIIGLPEEDIEDVKNTFRIIKELSPDSLTVHSLAVKRAARLNTEEEYKESPDEELLFMMMDEGTKASKEMGMEPYYLYRQKNMAGEQENTGFARPGKECIYNILMMEERQDVVALSCSGSTKIIRGDMILTAPNVKSLKDYIERVDEMIERKRMILVKDVYLKKSRQSI